MEITQLIQTGSSGFFVLAFTALVLGALHGLEPGHSKSMMAAFIIAIRGTVSQAALLGLMATISHTILVWIVALGGMYFLGDKFDAETTEPYFQVTSGILIIAVAAWMLWRTWKHQNEFKKEHSHSHDETREIDTGHGILKLEIFEVNQPPRFRISNKSANILSHFSSSDIALETTRPDGSRQKFTFTFKDGFLESQDIPEPHEFTARLTLNHGDHHHAYDVEFTEHGHHHTEGDLKTLDTVSPEYRDAHEIAHANEIRRRFTNQNVTTGQIIAFGLTGGLIPCAASITVLLLCLQLKKILLGAILVLCFSVGLAATLVTTGTIAALSINHVIKRWPGFTKLTCRAPYFSGALISLVGLYVSYHGLMRIF